MAKDVVVNAVSPEEFRAVGEALKERILRCEYAIRVVMDGHRPVWKQIVRAGNDAVVVSVAV